MSSGDQHWDVLAAYFSGEISEADRASVDAWRAAAPGNELVFAEARAIWENSGLKLHAADTDDGMLWARLKERVDKEAQLPRAQGFVWRSAVWQRVAAGIILVCVSGYLLYRLSQGRDVVVSAGQEVAMVYLPDSSKVWLNVNSTLTYASEFGNEHRQARLDGEGYFEIRRNASLPFVVRAGEASVRVKGTSFNVRQDSASVVLTVAEGTVQFASQDSTRDGISVTAHERATLGRDGTPAKSRNTAPAFASWRYRHNPVFDAEKSDPAAYLTTQYTWHKNAINQSVVEGVLTNAATLARYSHVVLQITYTKPSGATGTAHITVTEPVGAGHSVRFQKRLLDILTDTRSVTIAVASAVVEE